MAIDSSWGSTHLQRNEIFRAAMKDRFLEPTMAQQWVNWSNDIPADSILTELKINSINGLSTDTWEEGKALPERRMDTGQYTFNINEFTGVKVAFTDHFFETSFQANQVLAATPREMDRALDEELETKILALANAQTLNDDNIINTGKHRYVAGGDGTAAPADSLTLQDFSYAKYALKKAAVPMSGLIAVVSPETEHNLNVKTNIVEVSNNPMWEGVVTTGLMDNTGMRFIRNIYGFDVYVSDYLADAEDEAALTTYAGNAKQGGSTAGYKSNIFMSVGNDASPFFGAWGRNPRVVSWRDEDIETEYHQLTASYGLGLYRPESMITVLSNPNSFA